VIRFSDQQKFLMWERWRQGDTLREVARLLERHPSSVFKKLNRTGGIQPAARSRSSRALSLTEREVVSRGLASGKSLRAIARELNRVPSTVSCEVARNGGFVRYRAATADQATCGSAQYAQRSASWPKTLS
jgi:IS30 family transposase